jgi:hypothetical protein
MPELRDNVACGVAPVNAVEQAREWAAHLAVRTDQHWKDRATLLETLAATVEEQAKRIEGLENDCRQLELSTASAMALVLSHEAHIEKLERKEPRWKNFEEDGDGEA